MWTIWWLYFTETDRTDTNLLCVLSKSLLFKLRLSCNCWCTWHRLTRSCKMDGRRSNATKTPFCLREECNERSHSDWHPPLDLPYDLHQVQLTISVISSHTVYHHEIHHCQHKLPALVATLPPPCWHCSLSIHVSLSLPQDFTQTPWQGHRRQHLQCTAVRGETPHRRYSHQIFYGGLWFLERMFCCLDSTSECYSHDLQWSELYTLKLQCLQFQSMTLLRNSHYYTTEDTEFSVTVILTPWK